MSSLSGRLSLLLAALVLTAGPALAQRGFSLSPHVYGTGLAVGDLDDGETEEGGGLGLRLGLGVSKTVTLYFNAEGARVESTGEVERAVAGLPDPVPPLGRLGDDYTVASGELGAQFNLLPSGAVNPFLRTGLRGTSVILDARGTDTEDDPRLIGGGLTVGGGVEARLSRKLAAEAALELTGGAFNELQTDDVDYRNFEDIEFGEVRVSVGLVWRPGGKSHRHRGRHRR